jgi:hypothetical protein
VYAEYDRYGDLVDVAINGSHTADADAHELQAMTSDFIERAERGRMKQYILIWSPNQEDFARVWAKTPQAARRKAPYPYRKYLGEIEVQLVDPAPKSGKEPR